MKFQATFAALLLALSSRVLASPIANPEPTSLQTRAEIPEVDSLDIDSGESRLERRVFTRDNFSPRAQYLWDAASKDGQTSKIAPQMIYAMRESCPNPQQGVHCRLVVGKISLSGQKYDWDAKLYDLNYKEVNGKKMTVMRQMTWTPPIPAGSKSKYTPTFMGQIANKWSHDAILSETNKLQQQYPVYCLYKSVPYVGMAAPSDSTNCYDYADKLWDIISK